MMRYRKRKKGQAVVEFALVFPFFLLFIVGGIIDFGFAFFNYIQLQQIANDTAQWAAETKPLPDTESIVAHGETLLPSWWAKSKFQVTSSGGNLDDGSPFVRVVAEYESPALTPIYQVMLEGTTGSRGFKLATMSAYKVPQFVTTR